MEPTSLDFDTIAQERREHASASMKPITHEALEELGARLFTTVDHPWHTVFTDFLAAHKDSPAVHGSVSEDVEYIFFPKERKGMWYRTSGGVLGMGPIAERGLDALSEIVEEKKLG